MYTISGINKLITRSITFSFDYLDSKVCIYFLELAILMYKHVEQVLGVT
jgi:hypothetical protein